MNILNLKNIAIAIVLALVVGFTTGFYVKGKFVKADQIDAVTETQREITANIQQSLKTSIAVEEKVAASTQNMQTIRKQVAKRISKHQETISETQPEAQIFFNVRDRWTLDVGTVWLLNVARENVPFDTARLLDGASQAPSQIGAADFIDNDLEVVQLYHELAARHDALVDYVEGVIATQAK